MKVLTAAEMREVDRRTMELGISGPILMENAGHRAVEFMHKVFAPLDSHRVVILCGKGNNGGDGYVIARQLLTRFRLRGLDVVTAFPEDLTEPRRMFQACGGVVATEITPAMRRASLVVDAVLGTGVAGAAYGKPLELIREINSGFPDARVLAVDVPSGMNTDSGTSQGEVARADATITFTAPKLCHVLPPNCHRIGAWEVGLIGSPASLMDGAQLQLVEPTEFQSLLAPRDPDSNKGTYGHVLVVGGATGKTGAAEMTGVGALRAGAGLVTVACSAERLWTLELMTDALPRCLAALVHTAQRKSVVAIGPGLGAESEAVALLREAVEAMPQPMVIDADGLNALAGHNWHAASRLRVLTPHPGEMSRLSNTSVGDVQADRLGAAREYACEHGCVVVLKGNRTVIAMPDGRAWVNPTGTPAMATGGTGDVLTGLVAGFLAQFPSKPESGVLAAVYLHGRAGELAAAELGEQPVIATDLLTFLPEAIREIRDQL